MFFCLNDDCASSHESFDGRFHEKYQDIIVTDVCNSVSQFFQHGWMLPNLSYNVVVLILKFTGTDRSEDYHPKALAKANNVGEGNTQ